MPEDNVITPEIWKPIPLTEGMYEASSFGRLRRAEMLILIAGFIYETKPARLLVSNKAGHRYRSVGIRLRGGQKQRTHSVHSLVANAFHGPRPTGCDINHIDGKRHNNRPDNLEYVSRSYNVADCYRRGRVTAPQVGRAARKLTDKQVLEIKTLYAAGGITQEELGKRYGVAGTSICQIVRGKRRHRKPVWLNGDAWHERHPKETRPTGDAWRKFHGR